MTWSLEGAGQVPWGIMPTPARLQARGHLHEALCSPLAACLGWFCGRS